MNEQTHTFAVETTAEIEVLRSALVVLMAETLKRLRTEDCDEVLRRFVESVSDVPPGAPFPTPGATRMFEDIAAAIPNHVQRFADDVRFALE